MIFYFAPVLSIISHISVLMIPVFAVLQTMIFIGLVRIAKKDAKPQLSVVTYIAIGYTLLLATIQIAVYRSIFLTRYISYHNLWIVFSVIGGIILLTLGIFILRLKETYPKAFPLGILYIVQGIAAATYILSFASVLIGIVTNFIGASFFFNYLKDHTSNTNSGATYNNSQ